MEGLVVGPEAVAGDDWRGHLFIVREAATPPGSGTI